MERWSGKFVIGLTGNIGTGKSVVRRMLEHLGAFGIDADAIAHRVIEKGAPGYHPVVENFGRFILTPGGEINRARLGRIVFADPEALRDLENIIHPLVGRVIDAIIARAEPPVIVIEAIKLLEGNLRKDCDSIWVSYTPPELQVERLVIKRKMPEEDARQRILAQSPQEEKLPAASVVIQNLSTFEDTWRQVVRAWKNTVPQVITHHTEEQIESTGEPAKLRVVPGKPDHASEIAEFINRYAQPGSQITRLEIMEAFGEKAFLLLRWSEELVGMAGWRVENLVERTTELAVHPRIDKEKAYSMILKEIEVQSQALQCEAALVFINPDDLRLSEVWNELGYQALSPQSLEIPAWIEAAQESMPENTILLFKRLREDRVLRPI